MKKFVAWMTLVCLLLSSAALADGVLSQEHSTTISTKISESYVVSIPATLEIPFNAATTPLNIEVSSLRLGVSDVAGQARKLYVTVKSNSGEMKNAAGTAALPYMLELVGGVDVDALDTVLPFDAVGTKSINVKIAQSAWNAAPAGSYSGTVTFTCAIANLPQ